MWFEGAQSFTIGTFHERHTTLQKTLESEKNATYTVQEKYTRRGAVFPSGYI